MQKVFLSILTVWVLFLAACQNNVSSSANSVNAPGNAAVNSTGVGKSSMPSNLPAGNSSVSTDTPSSPMETKPSANLGSQVTAIPSSATTPTEAYKALYNAVHSGNLAATKGIMSEASLQLIEMQSQRSNKPYDEVLKNGLIQANLAPKMPEVRDQRVKDKSGAVEVFDPKSKSWQDVPFVFENNTWKVGVGDQFKGTYVSPGPSKWQRDHPNPTMVPGKGVPAGVKPPPLNQPNPTLNAPK